MRESDAESQASKRRKKGREKQYNVIATATWGNQVPGLNLAIGDIETYENEVSGQMQIISGQLQALKKSGNGGMLVYRY